MNIGAFNERVSLMIPIYVTNDYNRVEVDGYVYIERWGMVDRKHSKKFNLRFLNGSNLEGILTVRAENQLSEATKVSINDVVYEIESIIPIQNNTYLEIMFKEAVE